MGLKSTILDFRSVAFLTELVSVIYKLYIISYIYFVYYTYIIYYIIYNFDLIMYLMLIVFNV